MTKETDLMIDACIEAIKEGGMLTTVQNKRFNKLLIAVADSKGVTSPGHFLRSLYSFGSPQGVLTTALNLGLVRKPAHKNFVAKFGVLVKMETSLLSLAHLYEEKFLISLSHNYKSLLSCDFPTRLRWGRLTCPDLSLFPKKPSKRAMKLL